MKRSHVAALFLSMGLFGSPVVTHAEVTNTDLGVAYMTCSMGDRLDITLDNSEVEWEISNSDVVSIDEKGVMTVLREGQCDLVNKVSGFKIKLSSYGKTTESGILEINYDSDTGESGSVVVKDKTVDVQTVEVKSTVTAEENAIPTNFSKVEDSSESTEDSENVESVEETSTLEKIVNDVDTMNVVTETSVKAEEKGNYILESTSGESDIVKVVEPQLNQYLYQGSLGQSTDIFVSNIDVNETFESSDNSIAVVDGTGHVELVGTGEATIYVRTENNVKECKIVSLKPTVSTEDVLIQKGQTYQMVVENNFAELPVKYEIASGNGSVSDSGLVSVEDDVVVRTTINGDIVYETAISTSTVHDEYWEAMQPAIEECLGTPYVFGGVTPGVGMDCSAYVSYVYRSVGLLNGRLTAQGLYDTSSRTDNPLPGDMVFFTGTYDTSDYITHVGIYAGDGEMYHSGNPNKKVSLNTNYWQSHIVGYGTMIAADMEGPNIGEYYAEANSIGYSKEEIELIWAVVAQECSTGYEGALAVASCAMNRADINYGGHGTDILSQLKAPNQFCYSPSVSDPSLWQSRLGGNVADFVKQAVNDCIKEGKRNHKFLSFRSNPVGDSSVDIGGNWYFNE